MFVIQEKQTMKNVPKKKAKSKIQYRLITLMSSVTE